MTNEPSDRAPAPDEESDPQQTQTVPGQSAPADVADASAASAEPGQRSAEPAVPVRQAASAEATAQRSEPTAEPYAPEPEPSEPQPPPLAEEPTQPATPGLSVADAPPAEPIAEPTAEPTASESEPLAVPAEPHPEPLAVPAEPHPEPLAVPAEPHPEPSAAEVPSDQPPAVQSEATSLPESEQTESDAVEPGTATTTDIATEPSPPGPESFAGSAAGAVTGTNLEASKHKWYVVHVYSGYEQKAKLSLLERIKQAGMESSFGEVLIPMETVQETRGKSSRITSKTFYPGYIFVQMTMSDHAWHVVRDTPKVTGFVGGRYPRPVPAPQIASVVQQVEEGAAKPRPQVQFEQGDHVRVIDGAFANFTGAVEEVKPEKQKVRVLVSIFGRATPVELDYSQVEKTA